MHIEIQEIILTTERTIEKIQLPTVDCRHTSAYFTIRSIYEIIVINCQRP